MLLLVLCSIIQIGKVKELFFTETVGTITEKLEQILGIVVKEDRNIYLGNTNLIHMKAEHPEDYAKYGHCIKDILQNPDYVRLSDSDGSIEYVKEFDVCNEHVKVAVRLSSGNRYFARTLYVLNRGRVEYFIKTGALIPYFS